MVERRKHDGGDGSKEGSESGRREEGFHEYIWMVNSVRNRGKEGEAEGDEGGRQGGRGRWTLVVSAE